MTVLQQFSVTTIAIVELDTSSGASAYSLPAITPFQQGVLVKDATGNAGANNVTISHPTLLIDGAATYVLGSDRQSALFVSDGARVITLGNLAGQFSTPLLVDLNTAPFPFVAGTAQFASADAAGGSNVFNFGIGGNAAYVGMRVNGTLAAPTHLVADNLIAVFGSGGFGTAAYHPGTGGVAIWARQDWTDSANGTYISFDTLSNGTVGMASHRMDVRDGILVNAAGNVGPTGGDQGVGTINVAGGYYVNGTALADATFTPASWAPTDQSGAGLSFSAVSARYTKIGNLVHAYGTLTYPATGNGAGAKISLPIAVPNQSYAATTGAAFSDNVPVVGLVLAASPNESAALFISGNAVVTNATLTSAKVNFMLIYPAS